MLRVTEDAAVEYLHFKMKSYYFVTCVIAAALVSVSFGQVEKLQEDNGNTPSPRSMFTGQNSYINFVLRGEERKNCGEGEDDTFDDGVVRESTLSSGKWQIDGVDVSTVNGRRFVNECNNRKDLRFRASGTVGSMAGVEGSFEIHFDSRRTAVVTFKSDGSGNSVLLTHVDGALYNCRHTGAPSHGPFTLDIICWKLNKP